LLSRCVDCSKDDDRDLLMLIDDQCSMSRPSLDLNFALRVCSNHNKHEACVLLYKSLKMYDEALDAALKVSLESAEQVANSPDIDDSLRKSLWLKLVRHVIETMKDVAVYVASAGFVAVALHEVGCAASEHSTFSRIALFSRLMTFSRCSPTSP
jgi:hypothetical protein